MRRSLAISTASPNHGHGAIADDIVTMPSRKAAAMPWFTAWHMPKSSPRTISLISSEAFTHASSALAVRGGKRRRGNTLPELRGSYILAGVDVVGCLGCDLLAGRRPLPG